MSQENVEIVRRHTERYDGLDTALVLREAIKSLDLDDPHAVIYSGRHDGRRGPRMGAGA